MLARTTKYAIRALIYLSKNAQEGKYMRVKEMTKEIDVPGPFLAKILQQLSTLNIIESTRGINGGFSLPNNPSEIKLLTIVEALEGREFFEDCLIKKKPCDCVVDKKVQCPLHKRFSAVRTELIKFYSETSLQDILEDLEEPSREIEM